MMERVKHLITSQIIKQNKGIYAYLYNTYASVEGNLLNGIITEDNFKYLDYAYISHSGNKKLSSMVNILQEDEDMDYDDIIETLGNTIYYTYANNWKKLFDSFNAEYNPIENYSSTEERTPQLQDITSGNNKIYGFNSSSGSDVSDSNVTLARVGKETITKKGNIGVTTSQQMIESEIELRKKDLFTSFMNDVDKIIANDY